MNAILVGKDLKDESGQEIILNGEKYHLAFDMNAMCDLEERYGSFDAAMELLQGLQTEELDENGNKKPKKIMGDIRFILWVALKHENDEITEREAGKLITLENIEPVMGALGKAMMASVPSSETPETKNVQNPREK